jgi:hypothetical protein
VERGVVYLSVYDWEFKGMGVRGQRRGVVRDPNLSQVDLVSFIVTILNHGDKKGFIGLKLLLGANNGKNIRCTCI